MSELSTRLRLRRKELGLSQEELAQRMGYRSKSSITKLEKGVNDLPQAKLEELAAALETTPAYLLGLDAPCPPPGFEPLPAMVRVPLIGSIACGTPITAEQNVERYIGVPAAWRADFALTLFPAGDALHLIPKIGVLGIGCRRGTSAAQLEAAFAQFCAAHGLAAACITAAASIDLKADEPGLLEFCRIHGWPVQFYSAAQLQNVPGQFTPSAFVRSVTGVDNVCERAAVLAAGGTIILPKQAGNGVTFALALRPFALDWRWQDA